MHMFNIMGFPIAVCLCNHYIGWRLNTQDFHFNKKLYHDWLAMVYGRLQVILHKRDDSLPIVLYWFAENVIL